VTGRRAFVVAAGAATVLLALPARAQNRPRRVGFLAADAASSEVRQAFIDGMRESPLVEHQDFVMEWRFSGGIYERLVPLASELVSLPCAVIVGVTTLAVEAVRKASSAVPIVMIGVPDPIGEGFAKSLSRPGGNVTGLSNIVTEVSSKQLELLHTAVPSLSLVALLINPKNPSNALVLEQIHGAAYTRRIKAIAVEASSDKEIEAAFARIARARAQALIVAADPLLEVYGALIARLANASRLPTMFSTRRLTEQGGLLSYGQEMGAHYRRAATYVARILRGAAPGSLPIEQPTVLEFAMNRRTARAIGLVVPPELELRADRLVD